MGSERVPVRGKYKVRDGVMGGGFFLRWRRSLIRTPSARVEGSHVEDVDTLHLAENFETFETGRLLEIGGDGTGLSSWWEKVVLVVDLCSIVSRMLSGR